MRHRFTIPAVLAAALATGCLQKDVTHTVYLSPDGAVRWTVDEAGVYSDEEEVGKRIAEEQGFIGPALIGEHTTAQGFRAMGPDGLVRTTVIRDERPFHVITETHFFRADRAFERLLKGVGIRGAASLVIDGNRGSLAVRVDFTREPEPELQPGGPVVRMLEDLDELRFVLTEGKFIAGGGFDVPDRMKAVISREWIEAATKAEEEKRAIELVLTWQLWEGVPQPEPIAVPLDFAQQGSGVSTTEKRLSSPFVPPSPPTSTGVTMVGCLRHSAPPLPPGSIPLDCLTPS